MSKITLDYINIKNLFGRFTYHIDLRNGEDISVLIAPNGCGKTTIFSIVTFMFKPTYQGYSKASIIPFDECECVLSNGKTIMLKSQSRKTKNKSRVPGHGFEFAYSMQEEFEMMSEGIEQDRDLTLIIGNKVISYSKEIRAILEHVDIDVLHLVEDTDFSNFDFRSLPPRYREDMMQVEAFYAQITNDLKDNDCYLSVNFITADRLHTGNGSQRLERSRFSRSGYERQLVVDNPIKKAQKNTLQLIRQAREDCAALQTKVKDELPKKYLNVSQSTWGFEKFKSKWMAYVEDIEKYYKIGLLDSAETILNIKKLQNYYEEKGAFLEVYLDAFSKTLAPLEKQYDKLKLFADIFNERNRITQKTIKYGKDGIILTVDGSELPLERLSSGEKNDFVMFYDLIFNSQENGLVLIDEPEISLHIEWQKTFLDSLSDICMMNNLQSIVATHSPSIINGHRHMFARRGIEYGIDTD